MFRWIKTSFVRDQPTDAQTLIDAVRYVVLDTELTSLDHRSNRLLSIGAVAMDGLKIRLGEQFYRVVNPGVPIPAETVVIHRLRAADVERGEPLGPALEDFRRFVGTAVIVGHFVNLDLKILRKELGAGDALRNAALDTARVHHWLLRHSHHGEDLSVQLEKLDLANLAHSYRIETQDAHHALADAFLTAQIWQKMIPALQARKIRKLEDLLRIAQV